MLDGGVKENTICSMCGKKEPDQEGDDEEFDGKGGPKMQEMVPSDLLG